MCEEKEGVMRNAMTTRAPGGAKNQTCSLRTYITTLEIIKKPSTIL